MSLKQGNACRQAVAGLLIVSASALGLAGCGAFMPEHVQMPPPAERREAGRDQLLAMLDEQSKVQRLAATTRVTILEETYVEPATVVDAVRKGHDKPYKKKFAQAEVNGSLFLSRDAAGRQDVCMAGEMQGVNDVGFTLMGKGNSFWMLIPISAEERDKAIGQGQVAPRAKVLYGTFDPDGLRPRDRYSIRPEDFASLLFMSEARAALDGQDICYVERWPDYYVMNFLRPDWPNHVYSKIWFERQTLTVAIHQLFDSSGELVAEARFKNYGRYPVAKDSKVKVDMPTRVDFLWQRDRIMMRAAIEDIKLNGEIPARVFDEKRFEGYPTERIETPPSDR